MDSAYDVCSTSDEGILLSLNTGLTHPWLVPIRPSYEGQSNMPCRLRVQLKEPSRACLKYAHHVKSTISNASPFGPLYIFVCVCPRPARLRSRHPRKYSSGGPRERQRTGP